MYQYRLIRSARRSVCVEIQNTQIIVRAPYVMAEKRIKLFLFQKNNWIKKTIAKSARKRTYNKGEKFLYLGKYYYLKFTNNKKRGARILKCFIIANPSFDIKSQVQEFYISKSAEIATRLVGQHTRELKENNLKIRVKGYKSKWGSCSSKNLLSFDLKLAMLPKEVQRYLIIHELAHLKVGGHGKNFWREVEKNDKNYREHRKWLRWNSHMLYL